MTRATEIVRILWTTAFLLAVVPAGAAVAEDAAAQAETAGQVFFEPAVRPLLRAHCFHCHGEDPEDIAGGLDLRLRRLMAAGGDSGPAIVPGKHAESLLYQRVASGEMPPGENVHHFNAAELEQLARWIDSGAATKHPEPEKITSGLLFTEADRKFWSFQPVKRPEVPEVRQQELVRTPIDAFLLKKLEEQGFGFAPPATREQLLRRAFFDLLGLPPTPEETAEFLNDTRPDAWEQLIDRLLRSPHYGERWGRHWLDVAGYADSEGYTAADPQRKWAWKYRDYVIRGFNEGRPFNEMIVEQVAGDELVTSPLNDLTPEDAQRLVATGFLRMAADGTADGAVDRTEGTNKVISDTVQIATSALMGITVACAQCHHHKYDPITHEDYYRIRAVFDPAYDWKSWRVPNARLVSLYTAEDRKLAAEIEAEAKKIDAARLEKQAEYIEQTFQKELAKLPEDMREEVTTARNTPEKERTAEQKALLKKHPSVNVSAGSLYLYDKQAADDLKKMAEEAKAVRDTKPVQEFVRCLTEVPGKVPESFLFHRGDPEQPRAELQPAGLSILQETAGVDVTLPVNDPERPTTGRRLAWAKHLTSGNHPLTGRVLVNRIWLHHFGAGLVSTPGDFGYLGEKPSHPELLDWLASEFVRQGWDFRQMHRLILMSSAWRQGYAASPQLVEADPDNRLLGRMVPRRLEAEVIRDAILAVSGKLNRRAYGAPVPVMADIVGQIVIGKENLNAGRPGPVLPMHGEEFRRSVYVEVRRSRPLGVLSTFDSPIMEPNCEARSTSTVAPQSLMLMNSTFIVEQSEHFATRLLAEAGAEAPAQVDLAWQLAFARQPSSEEKTAATEFLAAQLEYFRQWVKDHPLPKTERDAQADPVAAAEERALQMTLASLCQSLLSSNEFLYID
ncbi:MAG: DUF1553 domain-containing protein [Planctomycetaceae bacterium]|nr:DUF1553 domain-containing protein [Planctomycetaceae bacterium]